jgi:hypothetical protein
MNTNALRCWATILALAAGTGCGDPPTGGGPPPQPGTPTITGSELTAGADGRITGTHLDKLTGTIGVDGVAVAVTAQSASEIRFHMPPPRACEVDGRPVAVTAGTLSHAGRLTVLGTLALRVGESRVIPVGQPAGSCLQLPAGSERYVFSVLNPSLEAAATPDALLTVHAWTGTGTAAGGALTTRTPSGRVGAGIHPPRPVLAAGTTHAFSDNPAPFDPRYATAAVGDTLPWVDWWGSTYPNCSDTRERIPTIRIVVAATSASGKTVVAFDSRSPYAQEWASTGVRARLTRMAEMMDKWAVPAVRESMDRDFAPLKGAGGRWFHVFRSDVPGWSVDNNDAPQTACRYSSEVASTVGPDAPPQNDAQSEYLAGLAIHEFGHHAATVYRIRRWGAFTPPMRTSTTWGSLDETWAQTVQETAARLASGQATNARYGPLDAPASNVPYADFYLNGYGETPGQSLWRVTTGASRGGYYDQGTRFLMYLRELWGDAAIGSTRDRFYSRVQELPNYDVQSLAALVGLSALEALDRWSLAEATDDLIDPGAAAAESLPQIQTWAPHDAGPLPSLTVSRTANTAWPLSVGRGNYAALYLFAEGEHGGKGVSLTFDGVGTASFVARITRVR